MTTSPIQQAVSVAGNQRILADLLKVNPTLVSQWVTGRRPVAAQQCIAIEEATGGKVTRYQLRPDVFGAGPSDGGLAGHVKHG